MSAVRHIGVNVTCGVIKCRWMLDCCSSILLCPASKGAFDRQLRFLLGLAAAEAISALPLSLHVPSGSTGRCGLVGLASTMVTVYSFYIFDRHSTSSLPPKAF